MHISGTKPSAVILCQTKEFKKLKNEECRLLRHAGDKDDVFST